MSTLIRIAGISLCVALHFVWSAPARAASAASDTLTNAPASTPSSAQSTSPLSGLLGQAQQHADSLKAAADSAAADSAAADSAQAPIDRFVLVSTSKVASDDVSISLGSGINATIDIGRGWKFTHTLGMTRKRYRQRVMEDITENVLNQADKVRPGLYRLSAQAGESYSKMKTLGLGRFGQDIIFNNTKASLEFGLLKPLLGASASDITIKADGSKGTNDFKFDRAYSGSASGTLKYLFGDILTVVGGAGASGKHETSYVGANRFGPMRSDADSVRAAMSYGRGQTKTVDVTYSWLKGVNRKVNPPRGNTNEILADPSLAIREEVRNRAEQLIVKTSIQPISSLALATNFTHSRAIQKYMVETRYSIESETNEMDATASYSYAPRGTLQFGASTSDALSDNGPVSLASYRERLHELSVSISQKVSDSISVDLSGSGSLLQRFYLKRDVNPRDYDNLYYRGEFSLRAPYRKFSANISGRITRTETINIDNSLSGDNRIEDKYQLSPRLSLKPVSWLTISQDYIIKIEFTDFVYTEDKNYLNRTTSLNTRANFYVFPTLTFDFLHSYLKKDTGSYLMRAAGRRYSRTNETFDHSLELTARYQVMADLLVTAAGDFRIQRSNVFGSLNGRKIISSTTVYESGDMKIGLAKTMKFGERGGISLDVAYVKNYGPYITLERRKYWVADAELTLRF